jgi:hypothetical protein
MPRHPPPHLRTKRSARGLHPHRARLGDQALAIHAVDLVQELPLVSRIETTAMSVIAAASARYSATGM